MARWRVKSKERSHGRPSDAARAVAGQSLAEFALILPVLLLLILGIIEMASLVASYIMVQSASREAARYAAAVGDSGPGTLNRYEDCDGIRDAALRVSGAFQAVSTIVIEYDSGPGTSTLPGGCPPPADLIGLGTRVIVRVRATHRPLVPLLPVGPVELVSETARTILTDVDTGP